MSVNDNLISCSDCGAPMSKRAPACVKCGAPNEAPTTIEQTSKKWKGVEMVGVIVMAIGVVLLIVRFAGLVNQGMPVDVAVTNTIQSRIILALFFLIPGLGVLIYARGMKWWHHG